MSEPKVVLCLKVSDGEGCQGSEHRWCHICAETLWVSPEGLALTGDVRYTCDDCFVGLTTEDQVRSARNLRGGLTQQELHMGKVWLERYLANKRKAMKNQ